MDLYQLYNVLSIIFMIIMVLLSIAMIIIVMMQKGNTNNIGAVAGGADSFFGKNKTNTLESKFKRWTIYIAASIGISSILYFIIGLLRNSL